jgi:hypothetical protein
MKTTVEYQPMQAPVGLNLSWRTAITGEMAGEPLCTVGESDRKSVLDPPSTGGEMLVVPAREKKSLLTSAEHDRGGLK